MAPAGKLTRRDSENKLDVKVTGKLRILITDLQSHFVIQQASILESEYTSSTSGTD